MRVQMKMALDWLTLPQADKQIHLQTWHSPDGHTFNQIDHCSQRGVNIDSDHKLVVAVDRLKDWDVASRYYDEL
jgi:hypothetical protein